METLDLAKRLISFETVTPVEDSEPFEFVQELLAEEGIGSEIVDVGGVKNLVAETGSGETTICLNGHMDVVEPGEGWTVTEPFEPVVRDGKLYGRGATDMKGGLAALINAFVDLHKGEEFTGRAVLMVVGDEETEVSSSTRELLKEYPEIAYALVGEPSDMGVKVAGTGVMTAEVVMRGKTSHASRPFLVENVVDRLPEVMSALAGMAVWEDVREDFPDYPAYSIVRVDSEGPLNSVPEKVRMLVDVRYRPDQDAEGIEEQVRGALESTGVDFEVVFEDYGGTFVVEDERFLEICEEVVEEVTGDAVREISGGGLSDGRFFHARDIPFTRIGTRQDTSHHVDEFCDVDDLEKLREIYYGIAVRLVR